jgi:hypothetical protein
MAYAKSLTYFVDDTKPDLTMTVTVGETGAVVDFTDAVSVNFYLQDTADGSMKVDGDAAAFTVTPTDGKLVFEWGGTDLDTAGNYIGWYVVYWGAAETAPQSTPAVEILVRTQGDVM